MSKMLFRRSHVILGVITVLVLVMSLSSFVQTGRAQLADPPIDQVAVKLKPGVAIATILNRYNANLLGSVAETNLYFLKLLNGQTANQLLPKLNADPDLYYAEPNYYVSTGPDGSVILFDATQTPDAGVILFDATGNLTATPATSEDKWAWVKIGLSDAQKESIGQGIVVAVLDTGLAPDHPLLKSNITAGYDFVGMTNNIYDTGSGQDVGHGTHVSGIIVTEAPGVQIMPIRVLNSGGLGTYWEVSAGIRYAVDHGAKIINMSMSAPRLTPSLSDALAYAASHGVIVVAAAGPGTGPNYPAAYPDRLAVLGVGATDQNDNIAPFSGGQPADTDVYAPGVHIYSAFPYNGYVYGSGTSMAAPMVAAEAALLMSRYPYWSPTQVVQRIIGKTSPVVGAIAGRIDLAAALNTGLELDYAVGDVGYPNNNIIQPRIVVVNNTPNDIPLSELKIRYWYTIDSDQPQAFSCNYTLIGCSNLIGSFVHLPYNSPNMTATSDTYLEVGFSPGAGSLVAGSRLEINVQVNKTDWSNFNEWNDYSYDATKIIPTPWEHITLYRNGILVWGVEPTSANSTPLPTFTNTQIASSTSIPSTSTRTSTPKATNTPSPIPPTLTRTPTSTALAKSSTPSQTNLPSRTATKSSTANASGTCTVTYANVNDWGTGFSGNVVITNNSSTTINGWTLIWTFPGNQTIVSLWNGTYTQAGETVSVTNAGYNAAIGANGGTVSFGFNANYNGTNINPTVFSLNGAICK